MTALSTRTATHSRAPLTRSRIAEAALAIVDRDGLDALSMRRLGAELGVEGMAIYRHFPNKAAVLAHALATGGEKLVDSTCKYVAERPLESVGLALVAGYLVSRLAL